MRVLIGCERSGIIREAFRSLGHDAYSCDLAPAEDGSAFHIVGDFLKAVRSGRWDLAGVHPPCQFLNGAGIHWTTRGLRDPRETDKAIKFAEDCWSAVKEECQAGFLENPVGILTTRSKLGKWQQMIQPYNFGEDASKGTCLWLHGIFPLLPTRYVPPRMVCGLCKHVCSPETVDHRLKWEGRIRCPRCLGKMLPRWGNQTDSGQNRLGPSETRSMDRARTYPGIARAMAEQWGNALQ
jgi:hypothetical protein